MARRPQQKTQAASVASYAICSELRARIRLQWRTMRRRSSHPRRKPSLRPPSRNIPQWQRRALPSQSPGRSRGLRLSHERKRSSQQAKMRRHTQSTNKRRHEPLPPRRETNRLCRSKRPTLSRKNRQKLRPRWCRHRVRINLSMPRAGTKTWSRLRQRLGRLFQIPRAPALAGAAADTTEAANANAVQLVDPNEVNELDRAASVESSWLDYVWWILGAALIAAFAMWVFSRMSFLFGRRAANAG